MTSFVMVERMECAEDADYYSVRNYISEDDYEELGVFELDERDEANSFAKSEGERLNYQPHQIHTLG